MLHRGKLKDRKMLVGSRFVVSSSLCLLARADKGYDRYRLGDTLTLALTGKADV